MSLTSANPADPLPASERAVGAVDLVLFVVVVLSWSLSWYALSVQVDAGVPVQTSLMWRFIIAAAVMFVWVVVARKRLRFPLAVHGRFAALGLFIFCLNFMLFYYGSAFLISGLLSVVFSLASVFNLAIGAVAAKKWPRGRVALGGTLGFAGIAAMFAPEIVGQDWSGGAAFGLALCVGGTLSFCTGNLISARLSADAVPVVSASAWGMAYGATASAVMSLALGQPLAPSPDPAWLWSLVFLALVSSVVAFWAYLTLLGRIGGARAGYATVVFPVVALLVSALLEDYALTALAGLGLLLVIAGNVLVLGGNRQLPSKSSITERVLR